jgi:hypothetical protein
MRITYISTLDDAFYYLNQAKGRPEVPSLRPLIQRYLRSCILLSWIALEETLEYADDELLKRGVSLEHKRNLRDKLRAIVEYHRAGSFDDKRFTNMRDIRNTLTHPKNDTQEDEILTIKFALQSFEYCYDLIRAIYPGANVKLRN